jgi:hypothetical protein
MKKIFVFLISFTWIITQAISQIVVTQADMPVAGDTLRLSVTNFVPAGYASTAMDTTWDFSALEASSQKVDTFVSAYSTPAIYQLFFVLLGGANLAAPKSSLPIPGLPVTDGFTFYKKSSSAYTDLGYAYTIQGLPLPAKYDNPDKLYQFPMTPGLTWSSDASFSITIPGIATYSTQRIRSNMVDGWGTLTTPYGTFPTLRVKSNLAIHDSVYIDTLGIGFPLNRNITEYKWLANGKGIPVLQIDEEGPLVTATYRDIYRMSGLPINVSLGPDTTVLSGTTLTLHAAISGGNPPYQILWNTLDTGNAITVTVEETQTFSVLVLDASQNIGVAQKLVTVTFPVAVDGPAPRQLQVYPNPSQGEICFSLPEKAGKVLLQVLNPLGKVVLTQQVSTEVNPAGANLIGLADGIYLIRISTKNNIYSARIQISK